MYHDKFAKIRLFGASLPDARLTDSDMPAVVRGERPQMHYGGIDVSAIAKLAG